MAAAGGVTDDEIGRGSGIRKRQDGDNAGPASTPGDAESTGSDDEPSLSGPASAGLDPSDCTNVPSRPDLPGRAQLALDLLDTGDLTAARELLAELARARP